MDQPIVFGTDGWRAVVARDFTFENLHRVACATARWLGAPPRTVVVGYDARFMGESFARFVSRVLSGQGVRVLLADRITPTPAISWATREYGADAGIVITASHNPFEYNGYKVKASFGGPATPDMVAAIEREVPPRGALPAAPDPDRTRIERVPIRAQYLDAVRKKSDLQALQDSGLLIGHDSMFGAGSGAFAELLGSECVRELHASFDPTFGGLNPEPIPRNLQALKRFVQDNRLAIGIANDGDADRIGAVDEKGNMVTAHMILALLLKYLYRDCGQRGAVVKTFATTHLLDKMASAYGLTSETYPIGFKYIAPRFVDGDVLVGGEESGGIAVAGHIPERDGIYVGLLLVAMMAHREQKLSVLIRELFDEFGPHAYHRADLRTTPERTQAVVEFLAREGGLSRIGGLPVLEVDTLDGHKHLLRNGWLLVRPSGTEPLLRIYAEAPSEATARQWVEDVADQLGVAGYVR